MTLPHHSDAPPFDSSAAPETVTLPADRASLRLAWSSGAAFFVMCSGER